MPLIYQPKGKAREYSPLALNLYTGGCDHACAYCYCDNIFYGRWNKTTPQARSLVSLAKEAAAASRQILLSFVGDPYCMADAKIENTRNALKILRSARCSVKILTKGGERCLRDIDLFRNWPDGRLAVGATLTFLSATDSLRWEPGAANPLERISVLADLKSAGIRTWASIEPVIYPQQSLLVIAASLPHVDEYKIGRWNHDPRSQTIDWRKFGTQAIALIRDAGRKLYVKRDLQALFSDTNFLRTSEIDLESLTLPDRPPATGLFPAF